MVFQVGKTAIAAESLNDATSLEMVPRNCELTEYTKLNKIPAFDVGGDFIAYASPDSTYAVTRRLMDSAESSILIGIYDFSADYIKELLLHAMQRGVHVSLMLDIDSPQELELFNELIKFGCDGVPAPSCASDYVSYFPSSHEKVIVIDGLWTLVQSGNYSKNSIPFNEEDGGDPDHFVTGNRDMGVAIRSKPLAEFFARVLRRDMELERKAEGAEALVSRKMRPEPDLVEAVPEKLPKDLFPSKTLTPSTPIRVVPVLTPENYMDIVPDLLRSAKKSIWIEQQYIRSQNSEVAKLLAAIQAARSENDDLEVRIILGRLFGQKDYQKERKNVANLRKEFGLMLGENIRYIDQKRFVHCHNKLVVVDNKRVLVSSQNWSATGIETNREAGVLMDYPEIARYYAKIVDSDWSTAAKTIPKPGKAKITPEALAKGGFVEVTAADYQEI